LADSALEKETYEFLETEEKVLDGMHTLNPEHQAEENLSNTVLCAIHEDSGILQACGKCSLKVHVKYGIKTEDGVVSGRCSTVDAIRD